MPPWRCSCHTSGRNKSACDGSACRSAPIPDSRDGIRDRCRARAALASRLELMRSSVLLLAVALEEIIANDRVPQRKRQPQNIFHQCGALLEAFVERICLRLLLCDHRADILQKIDAALFAFAAGALLVVARGALVAHCVVATLAEARHFAHVGAALRAFHCALLSG